MPLTLHWSSAAISSREWYPRAMVVKTSSSIATLSTATFRPTASTSSMTPMGGGCVSGLLKITSSFFLSCIVKMWDAFARRARTALTNEMNIKVA